MKIKARNFGPLKKLDIEVKPLTVLIGKNNLGKSYAAELLYVMLSVLSDLRFRRYPLLYFEEGAGWRRMPFFLRDPDIDRLTRQIRKESLTDVEIVNRLTELILNVEARNIETLLKAWLRRVYGVEFYELVNVNSNIARIECRPFVDLVLKVEITKRRQLNVKLLMNKRRIDNYVKELSPILQKIKQKRKKKTYVEDLSDELRTKLVRPREEIRFLGFDASIRRIHPLTYYIPAGRAGLIESYDTVVEALFLHVAGTPNVGLSISPLPGMAAEFYGVLRSLSGEKGPLSKIVTSAFTDLIGGDIKLRGVKLRKDQRAVRTKMTYLFSVGEKRSTIDLVHAASMIKELAPIYLIVQELVNPGQFLIIEEPESHLHPGAQSAFAKILALLVKSNVNVFLTTHSPIILRKLSHFVRNKTKKSEELIASSDAAIYWIKDGRSGSTSHLLEISKYGTLDEIPTFDEVVNELYDEEMSLQKDRL